MKAGEHEYFHPDFHSSMNMGLRYVGETHGEEAVKDYLRRYTENVYVKVIADTRERGLDAIADKIRDTYRLEKSEDSLKIEKDGDTMTVTIAYCPAVRHLRKTGREVCEWFPLSTETVMETLANKAELDFAMLSYDKETGAAKYTFKKRG